MLATPAVHLQHIASTVAFLASQMFWSFVFAPFLDVRFRRRTYAIIFAVLAITATAFAVTCHGSRTGVEFVMFAGFLSVFMFAPAIGGSFGSLIDRRQDSRLGAWITIYNIGGNGAGILISG